MVKQGSRLKPMVIRYPLYIILGISTLGWHIYYMDCHYTIPYMIPCEQDWGGEFKYKVWIFMHWGLRTCKGMETNVNESLINYRNAGFSLIMDTRMAPLMLLGDCGKPNIGFVFHDGLSFHFGCLGFGLGFAHGKNGGNFCLKKVSPLFRFLNSIMV